MARTKLHRRTLLRGMAGAALALPALEIMNSGRAAANVASVPKRYVFMYCGCSAGNNYEQLIQPSTVGPAYGINGARAPLAGRQLDEVGRPPEYRLSVDLDYDSVLDDVSIVSGLHIPWDTGSGVPPGGRVVEFHFGPSVTPQTSGMRSLDRVADPDGPTSDQLVAELVASEEQKALGREALVYRVQPISYYTSSTVHYAGRLSFRKNAEGAVEAVEPVFSPRQAYESLVLDLGDPEVAKAQLMLMRGRRSVLDLVSDSAKRITTLLGKSDRLRLERHYDELRLLEKKLAALEASAGQCQAMSHPGDDPAFGELNTEGVETETNKWSNEELRARIFTDILTMAFACDLSRVATFQLTFIKCYMNMYPVSGQLTDMHGCTHNGVALAHDAIAWGVSHFARLVARLRETTDFDGTSILDNSALLLAFEGGVGYDPEGNNASNSHSTENMCLLMAGRAGGLKPGEHFHFANQAHPAQVVLTAMNAVGAEVDTLGEISGTLPELRA